MHSLETESWLPYGMVAVLAITCGVVVSNSYYNQPLVASLAETFGLSSGFSGLVPMMTQAGAALGMIVLLPLGDKIDNRWLVTPLLALQACAMLLCATTTSPSAFLALSFVIGSCGIVSFLLPAYATKFVERRKVGTVTSLLATGNLIGIILARCIAGIAGYEFGWRVVYGAGGVMTAVAGAVMWRQMRPTPLLTTISYPRLIGSLWTLTVRTPFLRRASLIQALSFGAFNVLWIGLGFLLQSPVFDMNTRQIGILSMVALLSAAAAPFLGRHADRLGTMVVARFSLALGALGWMSLLVWPDSVYAAGASIVAVGTGAIGTDVGLRTTLYRLAPDVRMRLNSFYTAFFFGGGALFSWLTTLLYGNWGWPYVAGTGLAISLVAFAMVPASPRAGS